MKVIGHVPSAYGYNNTDILVQCSAYELSTMTGKPVHHVPGVGTEFNIRDAWRRLENILTCEAEFNKSIKTLDAITLLLENVREKTAALIREPEAPPEEEEQSLHE